MELKNGTTKLVRKGLRKFYDIYHDYFNENKYANKKSYSINEKHYTMGPIYEAF